MPLKDGLVAKYERCFCVVECTIGRLRDWSLEGGGLVAEVRHVWCLHLFLLSQVGGSPEETRKQSQQEANLPLI